MSELTNLEPLSLSTLVLNFLLGIVLSTVLSWFYSRYGESLSNRNRFAGLLPVLSLITLLVISVIKSSLALSLGLVGALSIVRFRTAIKDPEELLYLFMAIAIGIGLGAGQQVSTIIAMCILLAVLTAKRLISYRSQKHNLYLNLNVVEGEAAAGFEIVNDILSRHVQSVDMRRVDRLDGTLQLTYMIECKDQDQLAGLMGELTRSMPDCSFSFVDSGHPSG
jgi:hypothetical protein